MQFISYSLRLVPKLRRHIQHFRFCYMRYENRAFFENLFEERSNPWGYTSCYEQTRYRQTLNFIPNGQIQDALELACAEGHFTMQLAPHAKRLLAIDISIVALARAAERCKDFPNVQFRHLDFFKNSIPGRFDLIVCSEVLYYCRTRWRLKRVARKIANTLKPDGYLLMTHSNLVIDQPNSVGFGWNMNFRAKVIEETFNKVSSLTLVKALHTPLYRIHLFKRTLTKKSDKKGRLPNIIKLDQPSPRPPQLAAQLLWNGKADRIPILMYHRVAPTAPKSLAEYTISPESFEKQLGYLNKNGFRSVNPEDLYRWLYQGYSLPREGILITFDDGYRNFLEYAWPLLKRYRFSATIYLVSGRIGGMSDWVVDLEEDLPLLDWQEIHDLQDEGVSFGSHTITHPKLPYIPLKQIIQELRKSKEILDKELAAPVRSLAYPYGNYNRIIRYAASLCGYEFALSTNPGFCTVKSSLYALPRIEVLKSDSLDVFTEKLGMVKKKEF